MVRSKMPEPGLATCQQGWKGGTGRQAFPLLFSSLPYVCFYTLPFQGHWPFSPPRSYSVCYYTLCSGHYSILKPLFRKLSCSLTGKFGWLLNEQRKSLGISEDTKLLGKNGKELSINDFQQGNAVTVTLKDAFTEETPYYYPTVYEIKIIDADK